MNNIRARLDFPDSALAFSAPAAVVEAWSIADVRRALREVQEAALDGSYAVGFVAYEAATAFDRALITRPPAGPAPLVWFGLFDSAGPAPGLEPAPAPAPLGWRPDTDRDTYDATIAGIRARIAAGDVYQVNHTLRFRAPCTETAAALYAMLTQPRHGRYHALIETPAWSIVSASPELFIDGDDRMITTRPMKGTHRRGRWSVEDRSFAARLGASPKDRAENLMIVDLLRNDLGRIARIGSVSVPSMYDVETYPTVHQLTSTITAQPRAGVRLDDIFAATFPCGSVTGAPKVTAMRTIAQLERSPRGPYCGAVGVVRPGGSFTFNVGIRTLLLDHAARSAEYGAGGGITWDSTAAGEYDELVSKAALLTEAVPQFCLLETLRLEDGEFARLDLHLDRLRDSAAYWSFPSSTDHRARAALLAEADRVPRGSWRVRVTANRDGDVAITRSAIEGPPPGAMPRTVHLAMHPVSRHDRLLFHKTTARAVYDRHRATWPDACDVLLWNDEGEVTEFTTGNIVVLIDGLMCTPPLDCGLLAGTMRAELLRAGRVVERVITVEDIARADALWYINSVRGCVPVRLA